MARKTKVEKLIDDQVNEAYKNHGYGIRINIMDLSKIMDAGREAAKVGNSVDDAMIAAFAKYRQN